jgi:DNA-binding HxlR family transcriptional regulator
MNSLSKYRQPRDPLREECAARAALDVIRGRWKPFILQEIHQGPKRFSEIQSAVAGISAQALTLQLRQLEADGVIERKVFAEVPARVEYTMTELGGALSAVMDKLEAWGETYLKHCRREGDSTPGAS